MTPSEMHHGRAAADRAKRAVTIDAAYARHPERFVRRPATAVAIVAQ